MRHGRKSKSTSDRHGDVSGELRAIQRHVQNLTVVADEVILERDPRGVLPRSSGFAFALCGKHQNALAGCGKMFPA
jgi:hypothetical protein